MDYQSRLKEGFGPLARKYDRFVFLLSLGKIGKWRSELLSGMPGQDFLLDLGTGTGGIPYLAHQMGIRKIIGLDFVFEMLRVAKERIPSVPLINGDVTCLPVRKDSVDSLTLSFCFRYLHSHELFLDEARRVLKNNGRIGILDVCRVGPGKLIVRIAKPILSTIFRCLKFLKIRKEQSFEKLQKRYTVDEIKGLLEKKGFSITYEETHFLGKVAVLCAELHKE